MLCSSSGGHLTSNYSLNQSNEVGKKNIKDRIIRVKELF